MAGGRRRFVDETAPVEPVQVEAVALLWVASAGLPNAEGWTPEVPSGTIVALLGVLPLGGPLATPAASESYPPPPVELAPLQTADRRIVDTAGRDVLLRGANVNSLGEYWQGVPAIPPTLPVTEADWDLMASRGFSVVRLLVTWSRVEPVRDVIDEVDENGRDIDIDNLSKRVLFPQHFLTDGQSLT